MGNKNLTTKKCAHCQESFESLNRFPLCEKCFEGLDDKTRDRYVGPPKSEQMSKFIEEEVVEFGLKLDWLRLREKLQPLCRRLIEIFNCAEDGTTLVSNQGQAFDGSVELANYRQIIEKMKNLLEEKGIK